MFLQECLDKETLNYLQVGIMPEQHSGDSITIEDMKRTISQILDVTSIDDVAYSTTILTAFTPFFGIIANDIKKDNKAIASRFIKTLRKLTNKLDSWQNKFTTNDTGTNNNIDNESSENVKSIKQIFNLLYEWVIDSTFLPPNWSKDVVATEWYPYFFLSLTNKEYPDWLLIKEFPIELYGLTPEAKIKYIAALPSLWRNKLKSVFDMNTREQFKQLVFLVSFLEVLRREHSLLEETFLIPFPVQLPDNISSKFLRIKFDNLSHTSKYVNCAAIIMGVYAKVDITSVSIDELMTQQKIGNEMLTPIEPVPFASWQVKKILERHTLDPFFAVISSLKYSEPSSWAQKYFDFYDFAKEDVIRLNEKYSGTLYLNHFFPYHYLTSSDVVKTEGLSTPELTEDALPTGNLIYQPIVREGICIDLIDRIYLILSGFNDSIMRIVQDSDVKRFSFVQTENFDDNISSQDKYGEVLPVVRNYYKYLSDMGAWRIVKDKFEAELDKRVNAAIADIRHNVKHYIDHLPRQTKKIEEFLIAPNPDKTHRIIDYAHDTHKNIKIALRELNYSLSGLETSEPKDLNWNETILQLLEEMPNLNTRISIEYDKGNVSDIITFPFREKGFFFAQMMQNIIKNAEDHGFKGGNITNPKIKIVSELDEDSIYLSFMNNGIPISNGMSIDKYRTRGLSGKAGNTGLGGAQIDRIIRAHGGEICELASKEGWGFILKIKFKLK